MVSKHQIDLQKSDKKKKEIISNENTDSFFQMTELFAYEKPPEPHQYFTNREAGINCSCLYECTKVEYGVSIKPDLIT